MPSRPKSSRRALALGAAWATPVIVGATAAPAFAASPCSVNRTINWSALAAGTVPTSVTATGSTNTMSISMSRNPSGGPGFYAISNGPDAGQPATAKFLEVGAGNAGAISITLTFTFQIAVGNLSFMIGDIDSSAGSPYRETVYITSAAGFTISNRGSNVLGGNGTSLATAFTSAAGVNVPATSTAGNVTVTFTAPVTTFSLTVNSQPNGTASSTGHSIDLFNFSYVGC